METKEPPCGWDPSSIYGAGRGVRLWHGVCYVGRARLPLSRGARSGVRVACVARVQCVWYICKCVLTRVRHRVVVAHVAHIEWAAFYSHRTLWVITHIIM